MSPNIPVDSYIAASDFASPKHLADYLLELMKDKKRYKRWEFKVDREFEYNNMRI
jgi:hypothetical protein